MEFEYNNNSLQDINGTDIYDKAKWQIDGETPIPKKQVYRHFQIIFDFLKAKDLLTEEGIEDYEFSRSEEDIFWNRKSCLSSFFQASLCKELP